MDRAAARLEEIRERRWARLTMSGAAAVIAALALLDSTTLAISLAVGVVFLLLLALTDTVRRRELLSILALNPNAYVVPEVKRYGASLVAPRGRQRLADSLERVLSNAGTPASYCIGERVNACRRDLESLAASLRAPRSQVDPTSVALCWRLLTRAAESPLYNWEIPADDLGFQMRRIRAGIRTRAAD